MVADFAGILLSMQPCSILSSIPIISMVEKLLVDRSRSVPQLDPVPASWPSLCERVGRHPGDLKGEGAESTQKKGPM
jgi:hypothetical protein